MVQLDGRIVRMPELVEGHWFHSAPLTKRDLRGQVVLVDFWDYSCVNCVRTLPYVTTWHRRYADKGLTIIGIHTPEFKFAQVQAQVEAALTQYGIHYPVLLDNGYENWSQYANRAWPTKYLIDHKGYIRYKRQGEGGYQETEQAIQLLLRQRDGRVSLPDLMPLLREEDALGAVCYPATPELHAGYQGGGLFGGALGNPEGYVPQNPVLYQLPEEFEEGRFYVDGAWLAQPEALTYAGRDGGRVVVAYSGVTVNGVLAPAADVVTLMLGLQPSEQAPIVEVRQNGRFLTPLNAGEDILFDEHGVSFVRVTRAKMYQLVQNPDYETHELSLTFRAHGLALYAFTFTTCVMV